MHDSGLLQRCHLIGLPATVVGHRASAMFAGAIEANEIAIDGRAETVGSIAHLSIARYVADYIADYRR